MMRPYGIAGDSLFSCVTHNGEPDFEGASDSEDSTKSCKLISRALQFVSLRAHIGIITLADRTRK
jgi:glyoxylase-like metal-dependent hydrolase (beta-lactamase superfamily II)